MNCSKIMVFLTDLFFVCLRRIVVLMKYSKIAVYFRFSNYYKITMKYCKLLRWNIIKVLYFNYTANILARVTRSGRTFAVTRRRIGPAKTNLAKEGVWAFCTLKVDPLVCPWHCTRMRDGNTPHTRVHRDHSCGAVWPTVIAIHSWRSSTYSQATPIADSMDMMDRPHTFTSLFTSQNTIIYYKNTSKFYSIILQNYCKNHIKYTTKHSKWYFEFTLFFILLQFTLNLLHLLRRKYHKTTIHYCKKNLEIVTPLIYCSKFKVNGVVNSK